MELSELETPWVSFCMSTYKRPEFLKNQISSLLQQTFSDFEIIISDNDPEKSGKNIVELFQDTRISYYHNEENLGMIKSFNRSLAKSKGEFVVMITDDDPTYPDMLETLHNLTIQYPGYGVYQGGSETLCYTPFIADFLRSKVGINSCLSSEMNYNEVKIYDKKEFPYLFFNGKLGPLMLWSVGIVRREILIENGGVPDYGTEYFADHAYMVANGSKSGMVYLNRALGHQAIHGANFGFNQLKNVEKYIAIPESFTKWVESKLGSRDDWNTLKSEMYNFTGRAIVEFSLFIKKSLKASNFSDTDFKKAKKVVFSHSYIKKWKFKYLLLSKFPATFNYALLLKQKFIK